MSKLKKQAAEKLEQEKKQLDEVKLEEDVFEIKENCSEEKKKHKTLIAIIILFAGVACGSFFVDVAQLFTQKGFSAKALKDAQVIEYDGNTWVRYDDPKIVVDVFDADDCEECVTDEVLVRLRSLIPTLEAHRINVHTKEGRAYAMENDIKHIPSFVFENSVLESDFYQQAAILFKDNKNGRQYFEASSVGVPIGEYLETPTTEGGFALDTNDNVENTVILYDNPVAKESATVYPILEKIRAEQKEKMHTVVKIVPDREIKNSMQSAYALYCAHAQGKYNEYAKLFYANHANVMKSDTIVDLLSRYVIKAQMNQEDFNACMANSDTREAIEKNIFEASRYGIVSAPTFFINGEPHIGVISYQGLKEKISEEVVKEEMKKK
ncbi:MAG: hypothetical protein CR972_01990 [Candidatus Moraniibacteriota bacterium]|nr:MAG: hypothetical protein CR972_01990 [Candidatus Moranbacteria bacterium]